MKAIDILMMGGNSITAPIITGNGLLYNRYAIYTPLFPPSSDYELVSAIDMAAINGSVTDNEELKYQGTTFWNTGDGTNETKFCAIGSGWRDELGVFQDIKAAFRMHAPNSQSELREFTYIDNNATSIGGILNAFGLSVRFKYIGGGSAPSTVTDYDGNVYDIVNINGYYITAQNWKCTRLSDGTLIPNVTDSTTWSGLTTFARCAYNNDENNV